MRVEAVRCLPLLCCFVLLASCGFPGSVPETVKIGLSAPFEGLYRDLGYEALYAVRLAVRQTNEAGGIGNGRLVEMVALNDLNEPREAELQAGEMAVDPGILGVIGGLSPRTAGQAAPEYAARGLAFVTPFPDPGEVGRAAARLAVETLGARSAAILHGEDPADVEQAEGFSEGLSDAGGTVLLQAQVVGGGSAAGLLDGLGRAPEAVFLAADTARSADWIVALRSAAFEGIILGGPEVGTKLTLGLAGDAAEGILYASPFPAMVADAEFAAAYEGLSGGVAPRGVAAWCYAAAQNLLAAMDAALRGGAGPARTGTGAVLGVPPAEEWPIHLYVIRGGEFLPAAEYP